MDFFRKMVSGDKRRYVTDRFNLDLTYITDRIIAMAFPATGMEAAYRNDGQQVAILMKENHPGHFCIYNLTERKYDTSIFEGRVRDCGWFDHHAPPIAQLFEIVEHIHNFLLSDRDNVVAVHCLAGKGRTGTVIVSYLLYSGLFHDPEEAALFFALRRSANNWGVTGPSQQRYIRYFWEVLRLRRSPNLSTPLHLVSLTMNTPPRFNVGTKRSFTPVVSAVDVSGGLSQQVLWMSKGDRTFTEDNEAIHFDLVEGPDATNTPVLLLGDVNFTVDTWGAFGRKTKFARFAFNTGMLVNEQEAQIAMISESEGLSSSSSELGGVDPSDHRYDKIILRFPKIELDDACSDKRTPDDFYLELVFQRVWKKDWIHSHHFLVNTDTKMWERIFSEWRDTNGVACFKPRPDMSLVQIIAKERGLTDARSGEPPKMGGWLTKRGHRFKTWKKRWFALHADTLEYSKTPKSTTPAGIIKLDDIIAVQQAESSDCEYPNSFIIFTNWDDFLCYAQNESEMEEWVNTLNITLQLREQKRQISDSSMGQLCVSVLDVSNVPSDQYYAVITLGRQISKAATTNSFGKEVVFDILRNVKEPMVVQLWEENTYLPDAVLGEIHIGLEMFQNQPQSPLESVQWYAFRHQLTRVKLKIVYRPKSLIEAQRLPNSNVLGRGIIQIPTKGLSGAVTSTAAPRSVTLNSKVIAMSELKELIDILDSGISDALQNPDMDRPDYERAWDWTFGGISHSHPKLKEQRYSSMVRPGETEFLAIPQSMRPITLDIGLPPSSTYSSNPDNYVISSPVNTPLVLSPRKDLSSSSNANAVATTETGSPMIGSSMLSPRSREAPLSPRPFNYVPDPVSPLTGSPPHATTSPRSLSPIKIVQQPESEMASATTTYDPPATTVTPFIRAVSPRDLTSSSNLKPETHGNLDSRTTNSTSATVPNIAFRLEGSTATLGSTLPKGTGDSEVQSPKVPSGLVRAISDSTFVASQKNESISSTDDEIHVPGTSKLVQSQGMSALKRRTRIPTADSHKAPPAFENQPYSVSPSTSVQQIPTFQQTSE